MFPCEENKKIENEEKSPLILLTIRFRRRRSQIEVSRNGHSLLPVPSFLMMMTREKWSSREGGGGMMMVVLSYFYSLATCVWPFNGRVSGQSLSILQPFLSPFLSSNIAPSLEIFHLSSSLLLWTSNSHFLLSQRPINI